MSVRPPHEDVGEREEELGPAALALLGDNLSEVGNAERLVARHGADLRFCQAWGRWLVWDGRRFELDEVGAAVERAKETVRRFYALAAETSDDGRRKQILKHLQASETNRQIRGMLRLAESDPAIATRTSDFDADPWLLNVLNGTLELRTGDLGPHRREDLLTKLAPVEYDPDATAPQWLDFLSAVFDGDQELVTFMQRVIGYALTGSTREHALFLLYGTGRNGKSTLIETLHALLGEDYGVTTPTQTLLAKDKDGVPNDVARLKGARFVTASETAQGRRLDEATVKRLVGGDKLVARFMRADFFEFYPEFKLFIATNHRPKIRESQIAIWERIRLIPFTLEFTGEKADKELPDKLRAELPGILAWAVQGCLAWQAEGLRPPSAVTEATSSYRSEMDVLGRFFDEECVVADHVWTKPTPLYEGYSRWASRNNEPMLSQTDFGVQLRERGFDQKHKNQVRSRVWLGLSLRSQDEQLSTGGDPGPSGPRE